jgi:uncharacterized protein YutE (UPF0331/DUF86 family)
MTPVDVALVRRKLSTIVRNLGDLESIAGLELEEYRSDRFRLKGTERLLQETVESAVDVNLHLLRATGKGVPGDYYESFIQAGRQGLIPGELAESLAPSAGLRNRLVHEYDAIDDEIVLEAIDECLLTFPKYVDAVERFLRDRGY